MESRSKRRWLGGGEDNALNFNLVGDMNSPFKIETKGGKSEFFPLCVSFVFANVEAVAEADARSFSARSSVHRAGRGAGAK